MKKNIRNILSLRVHMKTTYSIIHIVFKRATYRPNTNYTRVVRQYFWNTRRLSSIGSLCRLCDEMLSVEALSSHLRKGQEESAVACTANVSYLQQRRTKYRVGTSSGKKKYCFSKSYSIEDIVHTIQYAEQSCLRHPHACFQSLRERDRCCSLLAKIPPFRAIQ